mmetsp:Transcript_7845/g.19291  ORF Transcript_7845/g.19291 Transcript_7845/m.19291 type:complete len:92 (+) Transcript_7845:86-361(+)
MTESDESISRPVSVARTHKKHAMRGVGVHATDSDGHLRGVEIRSAQSLPINTHHLPYFHIEECEAAGGGQTPVAISIDLSVIPSKRSFGIR